MSKGNVVSAVADKLGTSKAEAAKAVDAVAQAIFEQANAGSSFRVAPLGLFKRIDKKARTGRNPQTGEAIAIAAKSVITLKQ